MTSPPKVIVSASIAYDHVMSFNGSFKDHILADKAHVLSVSFLLDSLKHQRGGVAGNMAYSMALLGVPVALVGAVGSDFGPYRAVLDKLGVDLSLVPVFEDDLTSAAYMNADLVGNQIASFYPGAGSHSKDIDVSELAAKTQYGIISAGDPVAMIDHAEQIAKSGSRLVFDPAQQIVILSGDDLNKGIDLAEIVVGNDYEFGMIERKTGLKIDDIARKAPMTVVTYGDCGSEIRVGGETVSIPIAPPIAVVDPTGGGDAYRAGLMLGLLLGVELPVVGRLAALAATYAIEKHGPQEHFYTQEAFLNRFGESFPDFKNALIMEDLQAVGKDSSTASS
ncbi:MAG: carbohydrate kinase family protein [Thermomicrobiales bacterium]